MNNKDSYNISGDEVKYRPGIIESKWQEKWDATSLYRTEDNVNGKENRYHLTMLPYPSGDLHVGHWFAMTPSDTLARYFRMQGYNILFPMGFDAFGLPAENAALKGDTHPQTWTEQNIKKMRDQLRQMGAMFDWQREINSSLPDYYKWTQWWFLQLFKNGLAERKKAPVNWCLDCETVLANEQVINGTCERCESTVEQRELEQWFFRITDYAEELLDNDELDWPEPVKIMQRNWIGKSIGADVSFRLETNNPSDNSEIRVFTTRPDTLYGATFMVLAPEHPLVSRITTKQQKAEVNNYIEQTKLATEIERQATDREKTGVFTGAYCVNRLNEEPIPIWISDYVLSTYGTGAIMAVPAHDQRDFEFAQKFNLQIKPVVQQLDASELEIEEAYTGSGKLINSESFNGIDNIVAIEQITGYLAEKGWGEKKTQYRLRDWLISRQRYWGSPIPMIYCKACGIVPVPEENLPIELPFDVEFHPTGESPLNLSEEFVNTKCPECNKEARRETDTMDTFMCSSWYYIRYCDPNNKTNAIDRDIANKWLPVDQYTGGSEHAVMHLLYARFFYKAARDMGLVPGDEPFTRYYSQGQILGPDGKRMSKSRGNVVPPDDQVTKWGADTFRAYLMFLGPWEQGGPYDIDGIVGISRWLNRVWNLVTKKSDESHTENIETTKKLRYLTHSAISKVTTDLEKKQFNTAIATLMSLTNELYTTQTNTIVEPAIWDETINTLLLLIAPFCPHIAEELWQVQGNSYSIHQQSWPEYSEDFTKEEIIEIPMQINGKLREHITIPRNAVENEVLELAKKLERWNEIIGSNEIIRVIYVPERLLNIVIKSKP